MKTLMRIFLFEERIRYIENKYLSLYHTENILHNLAIFYSF